MQQRMQVNKATSTGSVGLQANAILVKHLARLFSLRGTTARNQQQKKFVINYPLFLLGLRLRRIFVTTK